jgi:DNA-binding HxlR family transcriptional regulator
VRAESELDLVDSLSTALRRRLVDVGAAEERLNSFVVESGTDLAPPPDSADSEPDAVRDLMLRALRCVSDPANYVLLRRLSQGDARSGELASVVQLPWRAVAERIADLVQVGLAVRAVPEGVMGATDAGRGLVELVEQVAGGLDPRADGR